MKMDSFEMGALLGTLILAIVSAGFIGVIIWAIIKLVTHWVG